MKFIIKLTLIVALAFNLKSVAHDISPACINQIIRKCPIHNTDEEYLSMLAHDPLSLKICEFLKCVHNKEENDSKKDFV